METEQLSIFDFIEKPFKITTPIRLIELFAGIGSQAMALKSIGANFETWKVVEFDKYAIASYNAIHGTNFPTMDGTPLGDVKAEIEQVADETHGSTSYDADLYNGAYKDGLYEAINIIDKHIKGVNK